MSDTGSMHFADPRDGDTTLDVSFTIDSYGEAPRTFCLPEDADPGSPPEITVTEAVDEDGNDVWPSLTDEQKEKIEAGIISDYDFGRDDDYDDAWGDE